MLYLKDIYPLWGKRDGTGKDNDILILSG